VARLGLISRAVPIRRFFRNTRTQKIMPKHGRAVESNRIGYGRGSARAKSSSIFLLLEPSNERRHILKMARTSASPSADRLRIPAEIRPDVGAPPMAIANADH
jgi:hypothetical protein